jgi:hypothetical protein
MIKEKINIWLCCRGGSEYPDVQCAQTCNALRTIGYSTGYLLDTLRVSFRYSDVLRTSQGTSDAVHPIPLTLVRMHCTFAHSLFLLGYLTSGALEHGTIRLHSSMITHGSLAADQKRLNMCLAEADPRDSVCGWC